MKAGKLELFTGILIGFLPFLGLPSSFFKFSLPILGALILYNAYKRRAAPNSNNEEDSEPYPETETFATKKDIANEERAPEEKKTPASQIPILVKKETALDYSSKNSEKLNRQHLILALQMLGYRQKQDIETSRLASRISMEKKKAYFDMPEIEATEPPEEVEDALEEIIQDKETNENIEIIVDEDLLLDEGAFSAEPQTRRQPEPKIHPEKQNIFLEESEEELIPREKNNEDDEGEDDFFMNQNQTPSMDADLLSRIGDEIEE